MFTRLRQPGGILGGLSVTAALFLGVLGVVSLLIAAATGSEFWSDERDEQFVSAVLFAVVGGLLMALILFWAILPLVLGPVFAVVAVLRARVFSTGSAASPGRATA